MSGPEGGDHDIARVVAGGVALALVLGPCAMAQDHCPHGRDPLLLAVLGQDRVQELQHLGAAVPGRGL